MILPIPTMNRRVHRELRGLGADVSSAAIGWIEDLLSPDVGGGQAGTAFDAFFAVTDPFVGVPLLAFDVAEAIKAHGPGTPVDYKVRLSAAVQLGKNKVQTAIVPFAVSLLHDVNALVRMTDAAALGTLIDASVPAGDRLIAISALVSAAASDLDAQGRVRREAEKALSTVLQYMPAIGTLPAASSATTTSTAPAAGGWPAWTGLAQFSWLLQVGLALKSGSPTIREAAVKRAREDHLTVLVPVLSSMLLPPVEPDTNVRVQVADALPDLLSRRLAHETVLSALSSLQLARDTDPDYTVRQQAGAAYQKVKWLRISDQQIGWTIVGAGLLSGAWFVLRSKKQRALPAHVSW